MRTRAAPGPPCAPGRSRAEGASFKLAHSHTLRRTEPPPRPARGHASGRARRQAPSAGSAAGASADHHAGRRRVQRPPHQQRHGPRTGRRIAQRPRRPPRLFVCGGIAAGGGAPGPVLTRRWRQRAGCFRTTLSRRLFAPWTAASLLQTPPARTKTGRSSWEWRKRPFRRPRSTPQSPTCCRQLSAPARAS